MAEGNLKQKTLSGFFWRFAERCGAQGVGLLVSIVLARVLTREQFGTVALILVFTDIIQVFVDSGLGSALIQKKDADDLDFSSVFYFNIFVCTLLYIAMFFAAPFIDNFVYNGEYDGLTSYIRVLSIVLLISGVKNIQHAYVSRKMIFKRFFFATLGGTIIAAIVGITMALNGFGVWAIIAQNLTNKIIDTIVLWVTVKWRPKLMFSFTRLKGLFSFGWKMLASTLINTVYVKLRQLIVGKFYKAEKLADYNQGDKIPSFAVTNIIASIDSVLFSSMSKVQDSKEGIKSMTRRSIKISSFIMWPMMLGLAAVAKPLIVIVFSEKWLPCALFFRIFAVVYAFQPIQTANLNAIKAIGRSDIFLKLEIIKKVMGLIVLFSTVFISVEALAYSFLFTTVASSIINAFPNKKLLNYSYFEQIKDILPYVLLSSIMFVICYLISVLQINYYFMLFIQIVLGIIIYIGGSILFKIDSLYYILDMVKAFISKKRRIKE